MRNGRTSNSQNTQPNLSMVPRSLVNGFRGKPETSRGSHRTDGFHPSSESTIVPTPMLPNIPQESKPLSVQKNIGPQIVRRLGRPAFPPIDGKKLMEVDESLADAPPHFVKLRHAALTTAFLRSIESVTIPRIQPLPQEIDIAVDWRTRIYPTHVLAVTNTQRPETSGKFCLYPIHNIIFASNCAKMPSLPPTLPVPSGDPPLTIRVPVYKIGIPHPETFGALYIFLYSKNRKRFATDLLLMQPPPRLFYDPMQVVTYAEQLAMAFSKSVILRIISKVHGCWRNFCDFGVDDELMWATLDLLWEVLRTAFQLSISTISGATGS